MPPKRPQALEKLHVAPHDKAVSITDTMTLVVKGEGGVEMRVKQTGIAQGPGSSSASGQPKSDAVMNKIKFEDLRIGSELGKGSQGKVRVAQHKITGEKYAMKYIAFDGDSDDMRSALEAELRQVAAVKHHNIVSSYEAFFRDGRLYVVLEYMDCGTMNNLIDRHPEGFSEDMLAYIARELFKGLEFLHHLNMIHRDIKPANVLANTKGEIKISDFGVAKTLSGGDLQTLSAQGSVPYMSPERIQSKPYSFNSDIWSAGLTIAECAFREYPFASLKPKVFELCQAIASGTAKINWDDRETKFSDEFKEFIELCLRPEATRPSATEMLSHSLIQKASNVNPLEAGRWMSPKK
ncbi:mitogen-activated protein kinase kinase 4 / MAPK4 [Leishmania donovani]|uniref:mitogen-activated protein kinase kinase n=3 Tax=Leishmania donovani species complex TaxID=38574 RepID=A4I140_LEIIN|nr:mitogen-activated protein kinase [Leishmania infantum JPCM5]XP_003861329.1 mitogen-activated protein kinase [Leishmania donovani]CAC9492780.1 mitogen-activated_protein_kinase [Leishmania infantum]AYU79326.1 mitogen-activated protein kinase [Leishmania donovani]TPP45033.1 Protein kinase domain family protein [Leishmania donovani]TPP52360.1 Protein kinase domain family protein [Leishmania donovani]CAJ1989318.1 mitogen-activated protein kinase kinase 4 / MAPK4 [Leishmania donovani]|eukprot:XP_001466031.1 mitogen-activated protein kinase [Leishmania infantum JPCM5]